MDKRFFYYKDLSELNKDLGNCCDEVSGDVLDSITNAIAGIDKNVIHRPEHYSKNGLTPVEAIMSGLFSVDETRGAFKFNILKYIVRYQYKNGIEDLFKAEEYLNLLISFEEKISKESDSD